MPAMRREDNSNLGTGIWGSLVPRPHPPPPQCTRLVFGVDAIGLRQLVATVENYERVKRTTRTYTASNSIAAWGEHGNEHRYIEMPLALSYIY